MSGAVVGNASLTRFDALIIGSGAGASPVAEMLTRHGQSVLVLEAGTNHFTGLDRPGAPGTSFSNDEVKLLRRRFIMPDPLVDPRSFRRTASDGDRTSVGEVNSLPKTVGGAALHADVKCPRFQPFDFRLGTMLGAVEGASFADWPITYEQLEPFYEWAEATLGVQGVRGADPFEAPRRNDYPMPPGVPMYCAERIRAAAQAMGVRMFPYPTAVNSRPYDGRPACNDCGFCGEYGCPTHAKGSPAVTFLRRALLSGRCQLRPETRVVRLVRDAAGTAITGVEAIGPDGRRVTYQADRYVLAASPIEDARLLLLSDPGGPGVGNRSGMVGRNLMFHFQTIVLGVFAERIHSHRGRTVTHGITDFRGVPNDPMRPLGGIVEVGGGRGPVDEGINCARDLGRTGAALKSFLRQSPLRDRIVVLTMQGEDAPQTANRVDLDPAVRDLDGVAAPRITYQSHRFETGARSFYLPKLMDLLENAGARVVFPAPIDDPSTSRHVLGTLRFGRDPATSVCDANGRFHDVGNLYASDGALFPTSSGYNPLLTITAVASRVGAAMVSPDAPERALPGG